MDKHISAAINLSINSFRRPEFTRYLIDTAAQRNIDCARLIFEVAESQTSVVTPQCLEALLSLRLKGFRLSIDDFGTGSSSFTHLKNIPFTELKIDREFVTGASDDPGARSILEESINLARRLSMVVVAEGVETERTGIWWKNWVVIMCRATTAVNRCRTTRFCSYWIPGRVPTADRRQIQLSWCDKQVMSRSSRSGRKRS